MSEENQVLCVDIGGTSTKVGALLPTAELRFVDSIPTQPDAEAYFNALAALIDRTRAQMPEGFLKLGVAIAGFLDPKRSCLLYNSNIPWLEQFPLKDRLREKFPAFEIELEVDSNAAAMAEHRFGSGRGKLRFLCLTCGTGLGVGMIIDGTPLRFAYGCMGDMGHIIVQRDGPVCSCGGRGCAESMVSAAAIIKHYQSLTGAQQLPGLREIIDASSLGDKTAVAVLTAAGEWLGVAAASMANTLFPDHIAIAGGLSTGGQLVMIGAEHAFHKAASTFAKSRATFSLATLASSATLVGAGCSFL